MDNENKHIEDEDLENIAPSLSKLKKENNFNVPANYFEELPTQIQERISQTNSKTTFLDKVKLLISLKTTKLALVSSTAVSVLIISFLILNSETILEEPEFAISINFEPFSDDELIAYVETEQYTDNETRDLYIEKKIEEENIPIEIIDVVNESLASPSENAKTNETILPKELELEKTVLDDILLDENIDIDDLDLFDEY